jgi:hypothetical protein
MLKDGNPAAEYFVLLVSSAVKHAQAPTTEPEGATTSPVVPAAHPVLAASTSNPEPLSSQEKRHERSAESLRVDRDMRAEIARRRLATIGTPARETGLPMSPSASPQAQALGVHSASNAPSPAAAEVSPALALPLRRHASTPAEISKSLLPAGAHASRSTGPVAIVGERQGYSTQLAQALAAANHASAVAASMSPLNVHMGLGMGSIGPYGPSMLPYSPGTFPFTATNISNTPTFTGPTAMDSPLALGPGALVAHAPPSLNLNSTAQALLAPESQHVAPMSPLLAAVMQRQAEVAHQINLLQAAQQYNTLLSASPQLAALRASPSMSPHYTGTGSPLLDLSAQSLEMPAFQLPPASSPIIGRQQARGVGSKDVSQYKRRDMVDVSSPADIRRRRKAHGTSDEDSEPERRPRHRSSSDPFTDHPGTEQGPPVQAVQQPAEPHAVHDAAPVLPAQEAAVAALQPRPLGLRRFLDTSLIIRLTVLCFVFFHGASPTRLGFVVAVMTAFYLMRVGILQGIVRGFVDLCCQRPRMNNADPVPAPPPNEDLLRMFTDTVIAGSGSIIGDLFAFVSSFFVSLWPQWVPEDYLRRRPAPVAPAAGGGA